MLDFTDGQKKVVTAGLTALAFTVMFAFVAGCASVELPQRVLELPRGENNPRNSEGDFVRLKDGRILFIYTHYTGTDSGDHASAHLAMRESSDGGRSWSDRDVTVVEKEGRMNVMSVSLLRLRDGRIALFYLVKNSRSDCRPVVRISSDEARTWSAPVKCVPDGKCDYYVLNNARAVQLSCGRVILPVCRHSWNTAANGGKGDWDGKGVICTLVSDDGCATWRFGKDEFRTMSPSGKDRVTTQEPGIVELKDGRLMMWMRTAENMQYVCHSSDRGETWTKSVAWNLNSPNSPASVKRLSNGDLLAIWNDHGAHPQYKNPKVVAERYRRFLTWSNGQRTPLTLAVSKDEGRTWINRRDLEGDPEGWLCYIACLETERALLLGYCAKDNLSHSRITRVPIDWLYGPARDDDLGGYFRD